MSLGAGLFDGAEQVHSLFFALVPDAHTAAALVHARTQLELQAPAQAGAGVPASRLHLTLHWLGEWSQLPASIERVAVQAASELRVSGFALGLDQVDCFGHGEAIWVLRPSSAPSGLLQLHSGLAQALARHRLRLPPGPAFAPHVSLRRRANTRIGPSRIDPVHWSVNNFTLIHSLREGGQTRYRHLHRWPLLPH